ncbi:MAG: transcriptional repressor, partial [Alphaproteobacteria bacterium]|nr:transcriptional repressor [Alphaproteobacteria bacterium]
QAGRGIEFNNDGIEAIQRRIAKGLGYRLVGHKMELYGVPLNGDNPAEDADGD